MFPGTSFLSNFRWWKAKPKWIHNWSVVPYFCFYKHEGLRKGVNIHTTRVNKTEVTFLFKTHIYLCTHKCTCTYEHPNPLQVKYYSVFKRLFPVLLTPWFQLLSTLTPLLGPYGTLLVVPYSAFPEPPLVSPHFDSREFPSKTDSWATCVLDSPEHPPNHDPRPLTHRPYLSLIHPLVVLSYTRKWFPQWYCTRPSLLFTTSISV